MILPITQTLRSVLLAFVLSLAAALVHPMAGLVVFVGVMIAAGTLRDAANLTHPAYVMTTLAGIYFIGGGLNISSHRGEITEEMQSLCYWFLVTLVGGCTVLDLRRVRGAPVRFSVPPHYLALAAVPGLAGLAWIGLSPGFPLLFPERFLDVTPKAFFLAETLFVPFILVLHNYYGDERRPLLHRRILVGSLLILISLPGYRGWPIIMLFCLALVSVIRYPKRVLVVGVTVVAMVVVLISGLSYFRRQNNAALLSAEIMLERADAAHLGTAAGLLHVTLRESIALSQRLIARRASDHVKVQADDSMFFADFLSMLPGHQVSGGKLVASAFGVKSGVGLTPGALGALVYEFGYTGAFGIAFLLGITVAFFYRRAKAMASSGFYVLYFVIIIYAVHYLHRGIPKPSYVLIPAAALLLLGMSAASSRRAAPHARGFALGG